MGYDPTPDNIAKLVSVTREEEAVAKAALDPKAQDSVKFGLRLICTGNYTGPG